MYKSKRRPDSKDVGNASLIPTYSDFKSRHGVQSHFRNRHFSTVFPEIGIEKHSWKKVHEPKPAYKLWIYALSHWRDSFVCAHEQVYVGWVKPFTAYPTKAAFWTAEVFHGLTMKIIFFKGRDTIEKKMLGTLRLSQPTAISSYVMECVARQSDTRLLFEI